MPTMNKEACHVAMAYVSRAMRTFYYFHTCMNTGRQGGLQGERHEAVRHTGSHEEAGKDAGRETCREGDMQEERHAGR